MKTDNLIIGQGICGSLLSWYLYREGQSFMVLDEERENSPSRIAAGVINPVTGRRYSYTWMIDELIPFVQQAYEQMEQQLNISLITYKSILDFFPSVQMQQAFLERLTENDTYLHSYPNQNHFNGSFQYDFGCGEIRPAFTVNVGLLLKTWREKLASLGAIRSERFDVAGLQVEEDGLRYGDIEARRIIFCDGMSSAAHPWFQRLPFAPSKGEALIIESEHLPADHIFKKGMMLVPLAEPHHFWLGSNYLWEFENDQPSELFYQQATTLLNNWLKRPYRVLDHKAALRPSTLERRPFVGFHPAYPNIGMLNGMGTKGTSLAPFFANQLAQQIVHNFPLTPEADLKRFTKTLTRE
jgi:glycine/D-amino acid oxidase-like deaminating enzyme